MKSCFFVFILFASFSNQTVWAQCKARISATPSSTTGCSGFGIQFNDISTTSGIILSRSWSFGDGSSNLTLPRPTHTFTAGGLAVYTVTLAINCFPSNRRDTARYPLTVYPLPTASFSPDKTVLCAVSDQVCLTNNSTSSSGTTYLWDFGDFNTSTTPNPCHTYYINGTVDVELTVTNQYKCPAKAKTILTIKESPSPDFSIVPTSGCFPITPLISNNTPAGNSNIVSWFWDMGNGITSTNQVPPVVTYTTSGNYFIQLAATNDQGCTNFNNSPFLVSSKPVFGWKAPTTVCANTPTIVAITTTSPITSYGWSAGDGVVSGSDSAVAISWPTGGTKKVVVTMFSNGCIVSDSININVLPPTSGTLTFTKGSNSLCLGDSATLTVAPVGMKQYVFSNGNIILQNSTTNNILVLNNLQTSTVVNSYFIDLNNCRVNLPTQTITVSSRPNITLSNNLSNNNACIGQPIVFNVTPANLSKYDFINQNGIVTQSSALPTYTLSSINTPGTMYVSGTNVSCTNRSNTLTYSPVDSIQTPNVYCGTTSGTAITFLWDAVSGAASYQISANGSSFIHPTAGNQSLTETFIGLNAGDSITLQVKVLANPPCNDQKVSNTVTCYATSCTNPLNFLLTSTGSNCSGNLQIVRAFNVKTTTGYYFSYTLYKGTTNLFSRTTTDSLFTIGTLTGGQFRLQVSLINPQNSNCPPITKSITINSIEVPKIKLSSPYKYCPNQTAIFNIMPTNMDFYTYSFSNGVSTTISSPNLFSNLSAGTYTLTISSQFKNCVALPFDTTFTLLPLTAAGFRILKNYVCGNSTEIEIFPKSSGLTYTLLADYKTGRDIDRRFDNYELNIVKFKDFKKNYDELLYSGQPILRDSTDFYSIYLSVKTTDVNNCSLGFTPDSLFYFSGLFPKNADVKSDSSLVVDCQYNFKDSIRTDFTNIKLTTSYKWEEGLKQYDFNSQTRTILYTVPGIFFTRNVSYTLIRSSTCNNSYVKTINNSRINYEITMSPADNCDLFRTFNLETSQGVQFSSSAFLGQSVIWSNGFISKDGSLTIPYSTKQDTLINLSAKLYGVCLNYPISSGVFKLKRDRKVFYQSYAICTDTVLAKPIEMKMDSIEYKFHRWMQTYAFDSLAPDGDFKRLTKSIVPFNVDTTSSNIKLLLPPREGYYIFKSLRCLYPTGYICCDTIYHYVCASRCAEHFVANALSPNNDSKNDTWELHRFKQSPKVQVFNRWGDVVYENTSYDNSWQGTSKSGLPLPDGVYYYTISHTDFTLVADTSTIETPISSIDDALNKLGFDPLTLSKSKYDSLANLLLSENGLPVVGAKERALQPGNLDASFRQDTAYARFNTIRIRNKSIGNIQSTDPNTPINMGGLAGSSLYLIEDSKKCKFEKPNGYKGALLLQR